MGVSMEVSTEVRKESGKRRESRTKKSRRRQERERATTATAEQTETKSTARQQYTHERRPENLSPSVLRNPRHHRQLIVSVGRVCFSALFRRTGLFSHHFTHEPHYLGCVGDVQVPDLKEPVTVERGGGGGC